MNQAAILRIAATILVSVCSSGAAMAQLASGTPTTVPAGAVMTPRGLMDAACIHAMPMGGRVEPNGDVFVGDVKVAHHDLCTAAQMNRFADPSNPPTIGHDWVENSNAWAQDINGVAYFNELDETFTVPANPPVYIVGFHNPVLYFFPSFQNSAWTEIIQPVLSWGNNGDYGGAQWSISSWYWSSGNAWYSPPFTVQPGDSLEGYMYQYDLSGHYEIQTIDWTQGFYTYLDYQPINAMTQVESGVLEVYYLNACAQLPPGGGIAFNINSISQAGPSWSDMNYVSPAWSASVDTNTSPFCYWGMRAQQTQAVLEWTN